MANAKKTLLVQGVYTALQEVPGHVSIAFVLAGCGQSCDGCSSPEMRSMVGRETDLEEFWDRLVRADGMATCVLFMGGDAQPELRVFAEAARARGFATAVYTGSDSPPAWYSEAFDYVKSGAWIAELGPLGSPGSNQRLVETATGRDLSEAFSRTIRPTFEEMAC